MLDQADLDFGIYRIMNYRRDEIRQFIEKDLLAQVRQELSASGGADRQSIQRKLEQAIKNAHDLGVDPEITKGVKDLRDELAQAGSAESLENEVFSQLYNFFSRYYEGGDFVSLRRYKRDVYAIPYEGEEVKLHWANADQYYIKSSEFFKNYRFALDASGVRFVEFTLREASTEQNNNKSTGNTERRFRLCEEDPIEAVGDTLKIYFNYLPVEKSVKREALIKEAVERLVNLIPGDFKTVLVAPAGKSSFGTLLEKHLNTYTARHAFDYFIHKDLGGFLRRELDFFVKNELLDIDEIETQDLAMEQMKRQFAKIVAIKKIARKIIAFLSSLEDFQKSLWLKQKFVLETQYCLTLDRVPAKFYPEIAANQAQVDEWVSLFKIDKIQGMQDGEQMELGAAPSEPFARPITISFLEQNQNLLLDTRHFPEDFKGRLLAELPNLDENTDGLLIHSDNFQALHFLQERYREQVKCVYIDPPYNTDASSIIYKNDYKDSSFLSLIENRLIVTLPMMYESGLICVAIDDEEVSYLRILLESIFRREVGIAVVRSNPQSRKAKGKFSPVHEYALFFGKTENSAPASIGFAESKLERYPREDEKGRYAWMNFIRAGNNDLRSDRPKLFYPIVVNTKGELRIPQMTWREEFQSYEVLETLNENEVFVYPIKNQEGNVIEKNWQRGHKRFSEELEEYRVRRDENGRITIDFKTRMDEEALPVTWWDKSEYASSNYGAGEQKELFGVKLFDFPKAKKLVEDAITACGIDENVNITLDYFAGSGTTAHAVINLNRKDEGKRKYILVEQGEYFDTVLLPRIKKVAYAKDWKNGEPVSRNTGISHCLKYLRLESYEDTLNNLSLTRTEAQAQALAAASSQFRESYLIEYLFAAESRAALQYSEAFNRPFSQKMRLVRPDGEREQMVDVVETFNYLIGLVVERTFQEDGFRVVIGATLPDSAGRTQQILIVWRDCAMKTAADLNAFFKKHKFKARDRAFDRIFVNGEHSLQNILDETGIAKVVQIEGEFKKRMFN